MKNDHSDREVGRPLLPVSAIQFERLLRMRINSKMKCRYFEFVKVIVTRNSEWIVRNRKALGLLTL